MTVRRCPICDAERQDDGRASCACAARESAAAEDFSPLLVRPYVKPLEPGSPGTPDGRIGAAGRGTAGLTAAGHGPGGPDGVRRTGPNAAGAGRVPGTGAPGAVSGTVRTEPADAGAAPGGPRPPGRGRVGAAGAGPPGRRYRGRLVAGVTAAVLAVPAAVVGAVLVSQGAFDDAARDTPSEVPSRMLPTGPGLPVPSPPPPSGRTGTSPSSPGVAPPAPSRTVRPPLVEEKAPRRTAPTPADSPPPAPSPPAPTRDTAPPVLREGMSGPQVADLQRRLKTVGGLYDGTGDSVDGVYDAGVRDAVATFQRWRAVQGDPVGVYGDDSRRQLESETPAP